MKNTIKIALIAGISIIISCKRSPTGPTENENLPIPVSPNGNIGHDLFYSTLPISGNLPAEAGIHSLNFDGSGSAFLFRRVGLYSAPRDTMLVFSAIDTVFPHDSIVIVGVYMGDVQGKTARKLFSSYRLLEYVILSPDAQKIIYKAYYDSVYVYDIKSHQNIALLPNPYIDYYPFPVFSDDSRQIIIPGGYNGFTSGLSIMNTDGSNFNLLDTNLVYPSGYDWSPDGTRITYSHGLNDLYIFNVQTKFIDTIRQGGGSGPIAWSPLGNYIAGMIVIGDPVLCNYRISIFNVRSKVVSYYQLPSEFSRSAPIAFEWSPDEKYFYASIGADPNHQQRETILKIDPLSGTILQDYYTPNVQFANFHRLKKLAEH